MSIALLIAGTVVNGSASLEPPAIRYANQVITGFVFIDGEYIAPPYTVIETGDAIFLNDRVVGPLSMGPDGLASASIAVLLDHNGILISNHDAVARFVSSGNEVKKFLEAVSSSVPVTREAASSFAPSNTEAWKKWLHDFNPPKELVVRAASHLSRCRKVRAATKARVFGRQRAASVAYPMTIFGMLAGIWSLGHLLGSSPRPDEQNVAALASDPSIVRATSLSILGVFLLSGLDLAWTLLAAQTGQMRELNPLGSGMISNPNQLVAFKVIATLVGCGVLYRLRTKQQARRAAWWMCLVLTVLTFRWLVFNSVNFSG